MVSDHERWPDFKSIILSLLTMSSSSEAPSCTLPPHLVAWRSVVSRSIAAWDDLATKNLARSMLEGCHSLDDFLAQCGKPFMFWFFQQRSAFMSQKRMKKWSRDDWTTMSSYLPCQALLRGSTAFSSAISGAGRITLTQTESICAFIKLSSNRKHGRTFG
jgi:hypothetical protein